MIVIGQERLYSGESSCVLAKAVLFGQRWLYSAKSGCISIKLLNSGKSCYIRAKWLYSRKNGSNQTNDVVFGQNGCSR